MFALLTCLLATIALAQGASWRIVNGHIATRGQFTFIASISGCTASIINADTILTAGHCVCRNNPSTVAVGVINKYERASSRQDIRVRQTIIHPDYRNSCGRVHPMDIAVLKLSSSINFNQYVQPIDLFCGSVSTGTKLISMGFGQDENKRSGVLKYGYNTANYNCGRGYICSGRNPNHIYFGDSGGPMAVMSGNKMVQAGVNSGIGGYSMYSHVPNACSWIKNQM